MRTFNLYIGANNRTGKLELHQIKNILNKNHQGYTLNSAVSGFWQGQIERSCIVTIADSAEAVNKTVQLLKYTLKQQSIGVQEVNPIEFK